MLIDTEFLPALPAPGNAHEVSELGVGDRYVKTVAFGI